MSRKAHTKQIIRPEITNLDTGEVTYGKPRTVHAQFSDTGYVYRQAESYIKKFTDSCLPEGLSWTDQGKLSRLQTYIVGSSQLLGSRKHSRVHPLTVADMAKIFKCKECWVYKTIREAKTHGVLKEVLIDGVSWYAYNPVYGLRDKRISLETYLIFQDELKDVLPDWVRRSFLEQAKTLTIVPTIIN